MARATANRVDGVLSRKSLGTEACQSGVRRQTDRERILSRPSCRMRDFSLTRSYERAKVAFRLQRRIRPFLVLVKALASRRSRIGLNNIQGFFTQDNAQELTDRIQPNQRSLSRTKATLLLRSPFRLDGTSLFIEASAERKQDCVLSCFCYILQ